jgi:hypothetical protein
MPNSNRLSLVVVSLGAILLLLAVWTNQGSAAVKQA